MKLPTETVLDNGKVTIREAFALRHHFKPEDLFEYGMQPQFPRDSTTRSFSRTWAGFADAHLPRASEGVFRTSQSFFEKIGIDPRSPGPAKKIADGTRRAAVRGPRPQGSFRPGDQTVRVLTPSRVRK